MKGAKIEGTADKAARAFLEQRITVAKHTPAGLALRCQSERQPRTYIAAVWRDASGLTCRSCTCANAQAHPIRPRCWHVQAAELLLARDGAQRMTTVIPPKCRTTGARGSM